MHQVLGWSGMVISFLSSGNVQLLGSKQLCKPCSLQAGSKCINFPSECLRMGKFLCLSLVHLCDSGLLSGRLYASKICTASQKHVIFLKCAASSSFSVTSVWAATIDMANSDHLPWVVYAASLIMKPPFPMLQNQKGNAITLQKYHKTKE